jgi:hypothetical protein
VSIDESEIKIFANVFFGLTSICLMVACSEHQDSITINEKAKLTKELIIDSSRCEAFSRKLLTPALDAIAIEKIYHEAMTAKCIQKDV